MPNTKNKSKKSLKCILQARLKSKLGKRCTYTSTYIVGKKKLGKKEIGWLELVHKEKREKKIGWFEPV